MGKAKILVVEDDAVTVERMRLILTQAGYDVIAVAAGEEAVEAVTEGRPDLILMDIKLSGNIDGITAYEHIKKSYNIPVIFVSLYADKEMVIRAIEAEPSGHLAKPFKKEQLVSKVETVLAWHKLSSEK